MWGTLLELGLPLVLLILLWHVWPKSPPGSPRGPDRSSPPPATNDDD